MSAGDNITLSAINTSLANKQALITTSTTLSCNECSVTSLIAGSAVEIGQTYQGLFSMEYISAYNKVLIYSTASSAFMSINPEGNNVGFGINPSYRLDVGGTGTKSTSINYGFVNPNKANNVYNTSKDIVARFSYSISSSSWIGVSSDERIKTNIQDIDDDSALQLIMKIEPKTYEYVDKIERGNQKVYGFIAQQIKEVVPEAVTIDSQTTIPNIYKIGTLHNSNLITMDMDISDTITIGSNITLITSNLGRNEYKITSVNSNQFTVDKEIKDYDNIINSNIFVYGTKVNDFHVLEKNYIYTLNVCATQELHKLIKQQDEQIQELEQNFELLSNMIQEQQLLIDALKPSS